MKNPNIIQPEDLRISQIIDANLDRAREGLRVLEDWARFGLGKEKYVEKIKNFRQILGKNHLEVYKQSRNHIEDKCKGLIVGCEPRFITDLIFCLEFTMVVQAA